MPKGKRNKISGIYTLPQKHNNAFPLYFGHIALSKIQQILKVLPSECNNVSYVLLCYIRHCQQYNN